MCAGPCLIFRGSRARSQLSNAVSRLFLRPLDRILRGFVVSCKKASLNDFPKILIFRYFCNILLYFAVWRLYLLARPYFFLDLSLIKCEAAALSDLEGLISLSAPLKGEKSVYTTKKTARQ